jgi:regulator of sigma E protease
MTLVTTVLAFIVTLCVLIVVHELGHYWAARRCGVMVLRFSIGFGRPLIRAIRGADRTEWVVAAIPLGGYVRMLDERDEEVGAVAAFNLPRAFNRQSVLRRIFIVLAGPVANLLLAVVVYWLLNVFGVMEPRALLAQPPQGTPAAVAGLQRGDRIVSVNGEPVRSWYELSWSLLEPAIDRGAAGLSVQGADGVTRDLQVDFSSLARKEIESNPMALAGFLPWGGPPRIGIVSAGSAAEAAGLRTGDRIIETGRRQVASAVEFVEQIRVAPGQSIELLIDRDGAHRTLTVIPAALTDNDGRTIGRIGAEIGDRPELVRVRYGPIESVGKAVRRTWDVSLFSLRMIGKMIVGEVSWKNVAGPVTIADVSGKAARAGLDYYLGVLALISISIGVLNLLPIPMLDGGHLLYYLVEIVRGSPPAQWLVDWGQRAGIATLVMLTALALYNDLTRLFF